MWTNKFTKWNNLTRMCRWISYNDDNFYFDLCGEKKNEQKTSSKLTHYKFQLQKNIIDRQTLTDNMDGWPLKGLAVFFYHFCCMLCCVFKNIHITSWVQVISSVIFRFKLNGLTRV